MGWLRRLRGGDADLEEEIRSHLRMAAEEHVGRGESAEQARTSALLEFGNVTLVKEVTREMWGFSWLETFQQDQRYGLRMRRKNPGFTAVFLISVGAAMMAQRKPDVGPPGIPPEMWMPINEDAGIVVDVRGESVSVRGSGLVTRGTLMIRADGSWHRIYLEPAEAARFVPLK